MGLWQNILMEIFVFLLVALVLWFFMARYLTFQNNNIESKKDYKDPWETTKKHNQENYQKDSSNLKLDENENYIWNLNDSIQHYNKLSLVDKKYVINDVIAFKKVLADGEFSENETFKNFMNIMTEMRQQHVHKGPCKEWILASTIEAICQMYFLDKKLSLEFLSNPIFDIT